MHQNAENDIRPLSSNCFEEKPVQVGKIGIAITVEGFEKDNLVAKRLQGRQEVRILITVTAFSLPIVVLPEGAEYSQG
jgi:hypothetical protein